MRIFSSSIAILILVLFSALFTRSWAQSPAGMVSTNSGERAKPSTPHASPLAAPKTDDCATIAAPPPLATFGGPATVAAGHSEFAIGAGAGGTLFNCSHKTGNAWFGRWRRGLKSRFDLGIDLLGVQHQDEGTFTAKLAMRYRLSPHLRLEIGAGGADDSEGKSLNGDLGITAGTVNSNKIWNYYTSARLAASHGYPGSVCCLGGKGSDRPPNAFLPVGALGTSTRIADNMRFVFEGGLGGIFVRGRDDVGRAVYLSFGLLLDAGKNQ